MSSNSPLWLHWQGEVVEVRPKKFSPTLVLHRGASGPVGTVKQSDCTFPSRCEAQNFATKWSHALNAFGITE